MNVSFKLGIITDEISQNIFEAAAFCKKHGLDCMEVRSVNNHSPFEFTADDISDINSVAEQYGLSVVAISAPLFKCDFNDDAAIAENIENFKKCVLSAKKIGAEMIRGFDFWDSGISLEKRAEKYIPIADICEKNNIICVIEADPSVHSNVPQLTARLVEKINSPYIKVLFDPGNEVWVTGKASADAYGAVKPYLAHVHIKDADLINGKPDAVKVGTGLVDYKKLFSTLIADGYNGAVMLETHYRKNTELTEEQLKRPGGADFSNGALEASEESIIELKNIINSCKEDV